MFVCVYVCECVKGKGNVGLHKKIQEIIVHVLCVFVSCHCKCMTSLYEKSIGDLGLSTHSISPEKNTDLMCDFV